MAERASVPPYPPALAVLPPSLRPTRASEIAPSDDVLPTGLPPLDAFLGGLPLRHTHLVAGTLGAGVTTLLHGLLAAVTAVHPVLLLDPRDRFYPPAAAALGVRMPNLLRVPVDDPRTVHRALAAALRADACPLIIWDAGMLPAAHLMDRLHPDVRASRAAFVLVADGVPPAASGVTGATLVARHERWDVRPDGHPGYAGKTVSVVATDHRRHRTATMLLTFRYPAPLPPFLHPARKGVMGDAGTTRGGDIPARSAAASRRAG